MSGQMTRVTLPVAKMTLKFTFVENSICLMAMTQRLGRLRILTFVLGTLQLASPSMTALADGMLFLASVGRPATHVEAVTQSACPKVHAPDCGLCRFLTLSGCKDAAAPALMVAYAGNQRLGASGEWNATKASIALPLGRAPPSR